MLIIPLIYLVGIELLAYFKCDNKSCFKINNFRIKLHNKSYLCDWYVLNSVHVRYCFK